MCKRTGKEKQEGVVLGSEQRCKTNKRQESTGASTPARKIQKPQKGLQKSEARKTREGANGERVPTLSLGRHT